MLKRLKRPSPALVVASVALFVALGGTGFAAINYAQNSNHVDGKNAFTSHRSNNYVAGGLVATYEGGRLEGKLAHRFLADTPTSRPFDRTIDVTDGSATGTETTLMAAGIGTLTITCDDKNPATGVENPAMDVSFTGNSDQPLDVVGRAGTGPLVEGSAGKATVTIGSTDTFEFIAGRDTDRQIVVEGVARQDGAGTADGKCTAFGAGLELAP